MVELGRKLRELRQERQWTQGQVAKRIGVTASVISAYENGIRQPSYESLIKLVRLYAVSADYLLGTSGRRTVESQHLISLDGLTPDKIALVIQLVEALKE
ncbi:conserved hypothetical protein [uncultured Eubacteriales bacterium]|uniref:HTH cro/C1-type domain-containing protein n=1 Tax=uncultured Eubacteriales bacterium TaxID=172733 RepID=A0A212KF39_9FIRM|nr:conserved hypothetical protein [uncultured Eubacteriales bacterium]